MLTRRELVASSAAATVAAAISPQQMAPGSATAAPANSQETGSPTDDQRFKKAVKIGMVKVAGDLSEKFALLKELGFDGIELNSPGGPPSETVLAAVEATGLPVHGVVDSVHWNQTLSHPAADVRAEGVAGLKTALQAAKDYRASSVLLVPGVVNDSVNYEQCWKRSTEEIKKVLDLAVELQIDILFENVWNNFLTDPAETAKFIDQFDCPRVGAYYDVGNSVRYANPVIWIRTLGKRIRKLDIKEFDLALAQEDVWKGFRVELLEGSVGWYDVIRELKKLDFRGWGTAEIPGGDRNRLQQIAERMDRIFAL